MFLALSLQLWTRTSWLIVGIQCSGISQQLKSESKLKKHFYILWYRLLLWQLCIPAWERASLTYPYCNKCSKDSLSIVFMSVKEPIGMGQAKIKCLHLNSHHMMLKCLLNSSHTPVNIFHNLHWIRMSMIW